LLPNALIAQRAKLRPNSLAQHALDEAIVALLEKGLLREYVGDLTSESGSDFEGRVDPKRLSYLLRARAEDGFVVDLSPMSGLLPEELKGYVIDSHAVVETLRASGWLSEANYERALDSLGARRADPSICTRFIPQGAKLFLFESTVRSLGRAGVLEVACEKFAVFVDANDIRTARANNEIGKWDSRVESWLGDLVERLRAGLADGRYEGIDVSEIPPQADDGEGVQDEPTHLDLAVAFHLLKYEAWKGDVLCFDDRAINGYLTRDRTVPIIGIGEVLLALRFRCEMSEQEYYDKLMRLRAGNHRYVPLSGEEILYHLDRAWGENEAGMAETFELATLRKYLNSCLLDAGFLQRPPQPKEAPNQRGELDFISDVITAVSDALIGVWVNDKRPVEQARILSDWLLRNLYTGLFGVMHLLPSPETRGDGVEHAGLDIGSLFIYGMQIRGSEISPDGVERRRQFYRWLDERIVRPRLKANPETIAPITATIVSALRESAEFAKANPSTEAIRRIVDAGFYTDLPERLRNALDLMPELTKWLRVEITETVPAGGQNFAAADFWPSAEEAINGRKAKVRAMHSEIEFELRMSANEPPDPPVSLGVVDSSGAVVYQFADPALLLLRKNEAEREAVLHDHRFWFDCDRAAFEAGVKEIVTTGDAQARLMRVNDWRKGSAEYFYWLLAGQIAANQKLSDERLMPPDAAILLRHFALPATFEGEVDVPSLLLASADWLVTQQGLYEALSRFACLPVKIPECLIADFRKLEPREQATLVDNFKIEWLSPTGRLHFVDLILRALPDNENALQSAKTILEELFDEEAGAESFAAFEEAHNYVNAKFGYLAQAADLPASVRLLLIWAHASRLHSLFLRAGAYSGALPSLFQQLIRPPAKDVMLRELDYWADCLHPSRVNRVVFLTHAISSVLGANRSQALESVGVNDLVSRYLSENMDHKKVFPLLRDPQLAANGAGSFLGGDRADALAPILGQEGIGILASHALKEEVQKAISELKAGGDTQAWVTIWGIVGDLPLYQDLRMDFPVVAERLDIAKLFADAAGPAMAALALRTVSSQLIYFLGEEYRTRLKEDWLKLAQHISDGLGDQAEIDSKEQTSVAVQALTNVALTLAALPGNARATSQSWAELLVKMLETSPAFVDYVNEDALERVFRAPASQLHGIYPVLLLIRALSSTPL
jgi:hypothetical protein